MGWMDWLDDETGRELQFKLRHTFSGELEKRGWGRRSSNEISPLNEYLITDWRGLTCALGLVRYTLGSSGARVIYRGQDRDYPLLPSLYRSCRTAEDREILEKRLNRVLDLISGSFFPQAESDEREAVCQHYGMPTRFLDVADNLQTALWFAYDRTTVSRDREVLPTDGFGYINILAVPKDKNRVKLLDLRNQPPEFLRLHTQQAFAMKKTAPVRADCSFDDCIAAKFMVPRELLRIWSNHDKLPYDYMFPAKALDGGLRQWEALKETLRANNIEIEKYLKLNLE